MFLFRCFR